MLIPRVRPWRCHLRCGRITYATVDVETINKRFARWLAAERFIADLGGAEYAHLMRHPETRITATPFRRT